MGVLGNGEVRLPRAPAPITSGVVGNEMLTSETARKQLSRSANLLTIIAMAIWTWNSLSAPRQTAEKRA